MKIRSVSKRLGLSGIDLNFENEDFYGLKVGDRITRIGNGKENGCIRTDLFLYPIEYVGSIMVKFSKLEKMYAFFLPEKDEDENIYLLYGSTELEIFTEISPGLMRFYAPEFEKVEMKTMKTKNYTGNKGVGGLYQKIINQIPAHTRYRELFAGSGAVYAKMTVPAEDIILNDLDSEVQKLLQKRFPEITVTNDCTISFLKSNVALLAKETFIFLDPPYLHSTRSNSKLYKFEMTDQQHIEFLEACLAMKCNILIIHPKCDLYDRMLSGWRKVDVTVRYHQKTQIETMYMNYDEVDQLQSYSFLGDNCWERQRIKRKGDRLLRKLQALPVLEKKYILERLKEIT